MGSPSEMRFEEQRLGTFENWPSNAKVEARKIAKAGFFHTGNSTEVKCSWCGCVLSEWEYGDQVMAKHRSTSPNCPFIRNQSDNVPLILNENISDHHHPPGTTSDLQNNGVNGNVGVAEDMDVSDGPPRWRQQQRRQPQSLQIGPQQQQRQHPQSLQIRPQQQQQRRQQPQHSQIGPQQQQQRRQQPNLLRPRSFSPEQSGALKSEAARLATFENWPLNFLHPASLAKSGFFYMGRDDCVRCVFCGEFVGEWQRNDVPEVEHRNLFPHCPFVRGLEVGNIPIRPGTSTDNASHDISPPSSSALSSPDQDHIPASFDEAGPRPHRRPDDKGVLKLKNPLTGKTEEWIGIMPHTGPANPKYSTLESRLRTFVDWPPALHQRPQELAEAGFFYIGLSDQVKCFSCDGGLRNWQPEDEPWTEHARWFSKCGYVRLVKGDEFIAQCLRDKPPEPPISLDLVGDENRHRHHDVTNEEIKALMNSPPVQEALAMGIEISRVKIALKTKLRETGTGFADTAELMDAAFGVHREQEDRVNVENNPSTSAFTRSESLRSRPRPTMFSSEEEQTEQVNKPIAATTTTTTTTTEKPENQQSDKVTKSSEKKTSTAAPNLEQENRLLKEQRTCKICMDHEIGVVFLPCGHLICCIHCAPSLKDCPLCRTPIQGTVKTYMS